MRLLFLLSLLLCHTAFADLLNLSNPADIARHQSWSLYSSGHYLETNDYTAQKHYSKDWAGSYTPRDDMNLALLNTRAEVGVIGNSWRLTGLYRKEILIQTNRDTTDVVRYNKQQISPNMGQNYILDLDIQGFEARGVRLDKGFAFDTTHAALDLGVGLSLLKGHMLRQGEINGSVAASNSGYQYNLDMQDSYSKANYPFIRPATPIGEGYSLDLGASATLKHGTKLRFVANDVLGKIYWRNMPHTYATANSATAVPEADGFIHYNPTLSGFNDVNRRDITQTLKPKFFTQISQKLSSWTFSAGSSYLQGYWLPEVSAAYQFTNWQTKLAYDTRFKTVALGISNPWLGLQIRSENSAFSESKGYGINGHLSFHF